MLSRQKQRDDAAAATKAKDDAKKKPDERIEDYLTTDPMEIEIGVGLIRLADPKRGGDLLERIQRVRQNVAADIGIIMPKVRIRDNMRLEQNAVSNQNRRHPGGRRHARAGLAAWRSIPARRPAKCDGIETREPAFNTPATWIEAGVRDQAEMYRLHGGRAGRRAGHASDRDGPQACRRNSHPRCHETSDRRTEEDLAGRGRRIDSQPDEAGRSAAHFADAAARAGADPPARRRFWKRSAITPRARKIPCC